MGITYDDDDNMDEEGDWAGTADHPSKRYDDKLNEFTTSTSGGADPTAPTVCSGEESIPTEMVDSSHAATVGTKNSNSDNNNNKKKKKRAYSPFRDWRVYAVLAGVAFVVGISTGMAVRTSAKKNSSAAAAAAAATSSAAGAEDSASMDAAGTSTFDADVSGTGVSSVADVDVSDAGVSSVDAAKNEAEDESSDAMGDTSMDMDTYQEEDAADATLATEIYQEENVVVEEVIQVTVVEKPEEEEEEEVVVDVNSEQPQQQQETEGAATTTTSTTTVETTTPITTAIETTAPDEDALDTSSSYATTTTTSSSSPPIKINFSMILTTSNFDANIKDPDFGENLVDATFQFLRRKVHSVSSNISGMSMKVRYDWTCFTEVCPPDSAITAVFTGLAQLKDGASYPQESSVIEDIIQATFSESSNLALWADEVAVANIDITSVQVQQDGAFIGSYSQEGFVPSQQTTSPTDMNQMSSWAEGFQRIGPKEGTELFVIEPISMQLTSDVSGNVVDAKKLVDTTFTHFWAALSSDIPSFVGLRLRVHTFVDQQRKRRNLRALQGSPTNAIFTARIRTSEGTGVSLDDIHNILHSSLSGTELEQWMAAAVNENINVVAARVVEYDHGGLGRGIDGRGIDGRGIP